MTFQVYAVVVPPGCAMAENVTWVPEHIEFAEAVILTLTGIGIWTNNCIVSRPMQPFGSVTATVLVPAIPVV